MTNITDAEIAELRAAMEDRAKIRTHSEGCWLWGGHQDCAIHRLLAEIERLRAAFHHMAEQFDVAARKHDECAPLSAASHLREAARTLAREIPKPDLPFDRAAMWGELREMDALHEETVRLRERGGHGCV